MAAKLGGLARRAGFIQKERETKCRMLFVDSGAYFFKSTFIPKHEHEQMKRKAQVLADALKDQGYDVICPGDTDFVFGWETYEALVKRAGVEVVCSNLKVGDSYPLARTVVKEIDGVTFGFIGLIHPKFKIPDRNGVKVTIEDPATVAKDLVSQMRPKVDAIIALTHLGLREDEKLATKVQGIDFIFGGHSRQILGYPNQYGQTKVYQGGVKGKYIGWVKMKVTPREEGEAGGRQYDVSALTSELRPIKPELEQEPRNKKIVEEYHAWAEKHGKKKEIHTRHHDSSASSPSANNDVYWGQALCGQCHAKQYEWWKSTPHAHAFETLVKAKKQFDMECLKCHTTGFDALRSRQRQGATKMVDVKGFEDVQCESCHAPGSRHATPEIRSRALDPKTCTVCHNTEMDPTFDFDRKIKKMACPKTMPKK